MKLITTTALALIAALVAAPAAAQQSPAPAAQQAAPNIKPSSKALKAIVDLQTAVNNKDYASVPAKVAAAKAVASTKEDRYLIGILQFQAARAANDTAAIAAAVDTVAQSGYLDSAKTAELYVDLGGTFFKNKQYPQAVTALQRASAMEPGNAQTQDMLARALFLNGQKQEAAALFRKMIQTSAAAGQKAPEDTYKLAVQSALDAKSPEAVTFARDWLAAYPNADSWHASLAIYRNTNQLDPEGTLELLRLMQATGALKDGTDYALFAATDADRNNFNEAQAVLDAGVAAHALNPADAKMRELFSFVRSKPKATAADLAIATKTAANGTALLGIGDRYYAMGNYTKAAEVYRMAQGKAGVDPAVVNLHIGMALARAGDKAGAATALNAVSGPRSDIAKYWLVYVNQRG